METRRLEMLAELSRLGSMRAVADVLHTTTSTVSQQLAVLAREMGATLFEPDGRRVRLTPYGRRLAEHAVTILAAVEAARRDLGPGAEPNGTLRVAGFHTAISTALLPVVRSLAADHPRVHVLVREHEPLEALDMLASDAVDLALTYDYNLAPAHFDPALVATPLWRTRWGLGVPDAADVADAAGSPDVFARFAAADWIVNSRNTADEEVVGTIASMAGFRPRVTHQADSLDLVEEMIVAGLGVGLLPRRRPTAPGVRVVPLAAPEVVMRTYAVTRLGRRDWPPLALVMGLLTARSQPLPSTPRATGRSDTGGA
ncbi:MAG: LysR family transcriptional regulator [Streptomycetaceae bacterium]|nr:LysR family transcriptional regulator [Streptomycetaceae bacterium]